MIAQFTQKQVLPKKTPNINSISFNRDKKWIKVHLDIEVKCIYFHWA